MTNRHQVKLIFVGGFLGAGKTTALIQLGKQLEQRGHKVALISNDQSQELVDTTLFRQEFGNVREVAGGCFCCRFTDLLGALQSISLDEEIDIALCEPVGSCTDLVATIVAPFGAPNVGCR